MKGIYVLGVVMIFIVLLAILFYYEDNNFKIQVNPYSATYVNQGNGEYILRLNVSAENSGFLPMSSNITVIVYANLFSQSSRFGINKEFFNSTSISLGPFSKKSTILTYYFPSTFKYISEILISGYGYYNYRVTYYITNTTLLMNIDDLIGEAAGYFQPLITILYNNITTKGTGSTLFNIFSIYNTQYYNGTMSRSLYLELNPKVFAIKQNTYNLIIISNSKEVYDNVISLPYSEGYIFVPVITTPPYSSHYSFNVSIVVENNEYKYFSNFTVTV